MEEEELAQSSPSELSDKVAGITKGGKNFKIKQAAGYWYICFENGGQVPKVLKGKYTTYEYAQIAIDSYLSGKK